MQRHRRWHSALPLGRTLRLEYAGSRRLLPPVPFAGLDVVTLRLPSRLPASLRGVDLWATHPLGALQDDALFHFRVGDALYRVQAPLDLPLPAALWRRVHLAPDRLVVAGTPLAEVAVPPVALRGAHCTLHVPPHVEGWGDRYVTAVHPQASDGAIALLRRWPPDTDAKTSDEWQLASPLRYPTTGRLLPFVPEVAVGDFLAVDRCVALVAPAASASGWTAPLRGLFLPRVAATLRTGTPPVLSV
jgi:hypothetical protein